jgi:hypothetical protein
MDNQIEPVDDPNAGAQGEPAPYDPPAFNYRDGRYTPLIEPGELARARSAPDKPKRDRRPPARQMQDEGIAPLFPLDNL